MANKKDKPLEFDTGNKSKNSVLYNATRKQSTVTPEDYPETDKQNPADTAPPKKRRD